MSESIRLDPELACQYAERASFLCQMGRLDEAAADCDAALARDPQLVEAFLTRGNVAMARSKWDDAVREFDAAEKIAATDPAIYSNRGLAWHRLGQFDKALHDYERAHNLNPDEAIAHNNHGYTLVELGRYDEAAEHYAKAIELMPRHPNAYKNLTWLKATCPNANLRDGNQAVALVNKAVELAGRCPPDWLEILAAAHAEAGDFAEAVRWQTQAIAAAADNERSKHVTRLERYRAHMPHRI
jgi:tetratricopeptide (TPR) repeat protein